MAKLKNTFPGAIDISPKAKKAKAAPSAPKLVKAPKSSKNPLDLEEINLSLQKPPKKPKPSAAGEHNPDNAPEFLREVPVDLSAAEIAAKSQELVDFELKLEVQVSDKKSAVADLNAGIKGTKESIAGLVAQLTTKKETRSVKCFERANFSQNLVQVVRADNGVIVETRPMTMADRQEELI